MGWKRFPLTSLKVNLFQTNFKKSIGTHYIINNKIIHMYYVNRLHVGVAPPYGQVPGPPWPKKKKKNWYIII